MKFNAYSINMEGKTIQTTGIEARLQKGVDKKMSILCNKAKCLKCGDIIESKYRHNFVSCKCGSIFVDGGHDYLRHGGNLEDIEDLSEVEEESQMKDIKEPTWKEALKINHEWTRKKLAPMKRAILEIYKKKCIGTK